MTNLPRILTFAAAIALIGARIPFPQDSRARPEGEALVAGNNGDATAQLIFFAVVEGCYRDGVESSTIDALLKPGKDSDTPEIFVYGCPICFPALDGLRLYRQRPKFFAMKGAPDTFGPGLTPEVKLALESADARVRRDAWGKLFEKWLAHRLTSLRLTPDERQLIHANLELRKKTGMILLEQHKISDRPAHHAAMKDCPSCNAADEASKPKER